MSPSGSRQDEAGGDIEADILPYRQQRPSCIDASRIMSGVSQALLPMVNERRTLYDLEFRGYVRTNLFPTVQDR